MPLHFVRFRQTERRLQVSLVETRRVDGKVRHEHVASFGSVAVPASVGHRLVFWQRLHERLGKLSNRIDAATHGKVLGDVHARIPMVTLDEQQALKLENAKSDERFWSTIHDMHADNVEGQKALAATVERAVAQGQAGMSDTAEKCDAAKERRERLERGEDVPGGLGRPLTREDLERMVRKAGIDPQHCYDIAELTSRMDWDEMMKELHAAREGAEKRAEKAVVRRLLRKCRP